MNVFLIILAVVLAACTALPFVRSERWWIRILDFPRLQLAALSAALLVALWFVRSPTWWWWAALALASAALLVQLFHILPYTPLWRKEAERARGGHPTVSLLMANVQMDNRQADGLFDFIERTDPDLVVLDEPDDWWEQQFRRIEATYPHVMRDARSNTYGMLLYSKLEFLQHDRRYVVESEIPSFHVRVEVASIPVQLHFIHPKPPYPKEAKATTGRDAELIVVGREAAHEPVASIVAGDLNDVAWSHTTRLFQKLSGLLDPRRGRGMVNTFHARYFFARWPLDHLFHSKHFRLARITRGPAYGSDHFPVYVQLELDPAAQHSQQAPEADGADRQEADHKLKKAAAKDDPDA